MRDMVALLASLFLMACSTGDRAGGDASVSGGGDLAIDICDAFSGVDTACPSASPTRCFPDCEAGGCFCRETPAGPRWDCVIDLSCQVACAPIDYDACGATDTADSAE